MGWFNKKVPDLQAIRPDVGSQPIRRFGVTGEPRLAWSNCKQGSELIIVLVKVRHTQRNVLFSYKVTSRSESLTHDLIYKLSKCSLLVEVATDLIQCSGGIT